MRFFAVEHLSYCLVTPLSSSSSSFVLGRLSAGRSENPDIRELRNVIERAVISARDDALEKGAFQKLQFQAKQS
jgi:hypothetical protein